MPEFTEDRMNAVGKSWDEVKRKPRDNGVDLFLILFKHFPMYRNFFEDFRDTPLEELPSHPKLKIHGVRVIYAISSMIDCLEDPDLVEQVMSKTIDNHFPRGIREEHMKSLFSLLPIYMEQKAGDKYTTLAKEGWQMTINTLEQVVHKRFEELLDNTDTVNIH